jgi:hypothetical protein
MRITYLGRPATFHDGGRIHRLNAGKDIEVSDVVARDLLKNKARWRKARKSSAAVAQSGAEPAERGE